MRVVSWGIEVPGTRGCVHYEARVTPLLKGGMEWGSAPMFPSQADGAHHWSTASPELEGFSSGPRMRSPQDGFKRQRWSLRRPGSNLDRTKSGVFSHTADGGGADDSRLRVFYAPSRSPAGCEQRLSDGSHSVCGVDDEYDELDFSDQDGPSLFDAPAEPPVSAPEEPVVSADSGTVASRKKAPASAAAETVDAVAVSRVIEKSIIIVAGIKRRNGASTGSVS